MKLTLVLSLVLLSTIKTSLAVPARVNPRPRPNLSRSPIRTLARTTPTPSHRAPTSTSRGITTSPSHTTLIDTITTSPHTTSTRTTTTSSRTTPTSTSSVTTTSSSHTTLTGTTNTASHTTPTGTSSGTTTGSFRTTLSGTTTTSSHTTLSGTTTTSSHTTLIGLTTTSSHTALTGTTTISHSSPTDTGTIDRVAPTGTLSNSTNTTNDHATGTGSNPGTITDPAIGTPTDAIISPTSSEITSASNLAPTPPLFAQSQSGAKYQIAVNGSCLFDNGLLGGVSTTNTTMTPDLCASFCSGNHGSKWFAVQAGDICTCASNLLAPKAPADDGSCDTSCAGDHTLTCGGAGFLTLYVDETTTDFPDVLQPKPTGISSQWSHEGCFSDINNALPENTTVAITNSTDLSVDTCTQVCQDKNSTIAGLFNGQECRCGTQSPAKVLDASNCPATCPNGDVCGGAGTFEIYAFIAANSSIGTGSV